MASGQPTAEPDLTRHLDRTLERVNDAVLALDKSWNFTYINQQAARLIGRSPEDLLGKNARKEYPEAEGQHFRRILDKAMAAETAIRTEFYWSHWNRWFEGRIYPSRDGVSIFIFEISERKQEEEAARKGAELLEDQDRVLELIGRGAELREILDHLMRAVEAQCMGMLCSVLLLDPDGIHMRNGAAPSLSESYTSAIDGMPIDPLAGPWMAALKGQAGVIEDLAADPWEAHRSLALQHGLHACWLTPLFDAQRRVLGIFASYFRPAACRVERQRKLVEIAACIAAIAISRHRTVEALRGSEERLRLALTRGKIGIWEWDVDTGRLHWSEETKALFGLPPDSADPTLPQVIETIHPQDRTHVRSGLQLLLTQAEGYELQYRIVWPDGSLHWIESKGRADYDTAGKPVRVIGVAQDITEKKHAATELERREAQLAEAQRIAHLGSFEWDSRNNKVYRSEELDVIFGLPSGKNETTLEPYLERIHPEDQRTARKTVTRAYREHGSFDFETRIIRSDGAIRVLRSQGTWLYDEKQKPLKMVGICQDITERKQAENLIRQSEERFQFAARATNDLIWDWDLASDEIWWNQGTITLFKYPSEKVGPNLNWWSDQIHPEDQERVVSSLRFVAGSGKEFWSSEYRFRRGDGSYADVFDRGYVLRDSKGKPIRMIGAMVDITERKRALENLEQAVATRTAELNVKNQELQHEIGQRLRAEKLLLARNEELKGFAYTVSHDLKAPLRGISGYAQELERRHRTGLSDRALFCLGQIRTAASNLDRLIEDLLQYSRLDAQTPTVTEIDLAQVVTSILESRKPVILEYGTEVDLEFPSTTVSTWERGLTQVLTNLIDNALKYSRKATPSRIRIAKEQDSDVVRIKVSDNGIGFDMKYHDRIFGLFNRLVRSDEFEGTGAGLAIVKKVVDKLGGRIWADSIPGSGATFFLELPNDQQVRTEEIA